MFTIDLLKNHPTTIPRLSIILSKIVSGHPASAPILEQIEEYFRLHLNDTTLPLVMIALHGKIPVGYCSLKENEAGIPKLGPFIGTLIVDPTYQNQGIGRMLIQAIKEKANQLGFSDLYLYTFDSSMPKYFRKLGFKIVEAQSEDETVIVMKG